MNTQVKRILCIFIFSFLTSGFVWADSHAMEEEKSSAPQGQQVVFETSLGAFTLELSPDKAPLTVANFLNYVDEGFYDGTIFHRVIPGFMVQGGGHLPNMQKKMTTQGPVKNESPGGLKNLRGTISMARTSMPHSASAQFFINVVDNSSLDAKGKQFGYTVFGHVIEGMDVVTKIEKAPTSRKGPYQNVPRETILIKSARRVSEPTNSNEDSIKPE